MKTMIYLIAAISMLSANAHAAMDTDKYRGENRGKPVQPGQLNALWQKECGSCHIAYPPGLLPAESWRKVMTNLGNHFGSDASLTPEENHAITDFLTANASNRWRAPTAPERITETAWFQRKHDDHEVRPEIWLRAAVKTRSNCGACHPGAEKGDFEESRIRIPR